MTSILFKALTGVGFKTIQGVPVGSKQSVHMTWLLLYMYIQIS